MVAFGHTAVGVLVGVAGFQLLGHGDIAAGLIATGFLGVISHYLADLVPHGHFFNDPHKYEKLIIWVILFDLLLPVLFILGFLHYLDRSGTEILYILFGIGGSQLPDVIEGLKSIKLLPRGGILDIEEKVHLSTHWHGKYEEAMIFSLYDIWQIATFLIALGVIIIYL